MEKDLMAGPVNTPKDQVVIEYDCENGRKQSKPFDDHYAARRLYVAKLKLRLNPKVLKYVPNTV